MAIGINNVTSINLSDVMVIADVNDYTSLALNVNVIFAGWLYFLLLCAFFIILTVGIYQTSRENLMYIITGTSFSCSVIGIVMWIIGLMSDKLMWVFPLITALSIFGLWFSRRN